jgi:hypothetical protein
MPRTIALCYDFDGTLSPRYMQEYGYIPQLKVPPKVFWKKAVSLAKEQEADPILCYMFLMLKEATMENGVELTRKSFTSHGSGIEFFPGVEGWFARINRHGKSLGVPVEHYIISSGIKEMIEGTKIAKHFQRIYASSFIYDQNGVACWPALAVNYTTKTQFLFRINKGHLDVWDNSKINGFTPMEKRPVPFSRMILLGDGETDIPCMRLVKDMGGYSCAVHKPGRAPKKKALHLMTEGRVDLVAEADYSAGSHLEKEIKGAISRMADLKN